MRPEALAAMAAVGYGSAQITARLGSLRCPVLPGLLVSLVVGTVVLVPLLDLAPAYGWNPRAIAAFAVAGIAGPGIARGLSMFGVARLGTSVSVAVQASAYPMFAVAGAVLGLGEGLTAARVGGLVTIVAGIVLVLSSNGAATAAPRESTAGARSPRRLGPALLAPALAGLGYALADVLRKGAFATLPDPLLAAFVGLLASVATWGAASAAVPHVRHQFRWDPGLLWFALNGLLSSAAQIALMHALVIGDVAVVSPIAAAQPIVVVLLTPLLLRRVDVIDRRVVTGTVLAVAGITLMGRG